MINTRIIIQPKQIQLHSQQTLSIKLVFKRVLLTTNHQIQKHECSGITLKNDIGIITSSISFQLSREFELSNSKVCFDILSIKGKAITFLGNGTFDLLPYSNRTLNHINCRIQRCKDIYAHIQLTLRFQDIIQQSPKKQFEKDNPKTLFTESFENQSLIIGRRQQRDKPTAYQISRKNYKHVAITRDQMPTPKRDLSGSYKKRFQYMSKSKVSNDVSKMSHRKQETLNNSKISNKISKHSPCPRIKTPEPISDGQSPQVKTKIRHPQKQVKTTIQKKQKQQKHQNLIQKRQFDKLPNKNALNEKIQRQQIKGHGAQDTKQLNVAQQSKYKDISEKLQWIQQQIRSRQRERSPKQRSPRTLREKTTITAKDSQCSKRRPERSVNEYSNGLQTIQIQENCSNLQSSGKVYQSKVEQYREQLKQQRESSKSPKLVDQPQVKKFQQKFENIQMNLEDRPSKKIQQGSDSKIRQSKIKVYKIDDKTKIMQQSDSQPNLQAVQKEANIKHKQRQNPPKSSKKANDNIEESVSTNRQPPVSQATYKMMQGIQQNLMREIEEMKQQLQLSQQQKHEIKKSYIKQQSQLNELKQAHVQKEKQAHVQKQKQLTQYERQTEMKATREIFQKYQIQIHQLQEQNKNKQALIQKLTQMCEQEGQQKDQPGPKKLLQPQIKLRQIQLQNKHLKQSLQHSQSAVKQFERLNLELRNQIKKTEGKMQQTTLLYPRKINEQQLSQISSQGHSYNASIDQTERERKYRSELSQYKQKFINLQSQCRYKQNELKFLRIKMDTLKQQKSDLQSQIQSMVHNNKQQLAKRDSVAKFSQSSMSLTNNIMDQNKALKEQIEILKSQLHQLNELIGGSSSKNMLSSSRTKIANEQKLERLQKKVSVYQNEVRKKKNQFGAIMNIILSKGYNQLVDQVDAVINSS